MKIKSPVFTNAQGKIIKKPKNTPISWRISAYAYVRVGGKMLMTKSSASGKWELPGGGIQASETIADGVARECLEESGYKVTVVGEPIHFRNKYFYAGYSKKFHQTISLIYRCKLLSKKQNKSVINSAWPGEILEVAWQPIKNLNKLDCHPMFKPFLKTIQ